MDKIKLNNGVEIPKVGLGVFLSKSGDETANAVKWALEANYRHIDTAQVYQNEASVADGIKMTNVPREEIFITTKIAPPVIIAGNVAESFEESLKKLDTDYVDLLLLHWPMKDEMNIAAWKVLEKIYKAGKAKAIGVSNYTNRQMSALLAEAEIVPAVNQIQIDPLNHKEEEYQFCKEKGIYLEAWSPLGGTGKTADIFNNPVIQEMAAKYGKSEAQIIIRWNMQRDVIVIPKSVHQERIASNYAVEDFEIAAEDMDKINALSSKDNIRGFIDPENAYDFFSNPPEGFE